LRDARLRQTILRNANLTAANLEDATLRNADLTGASILGARLDNATLVGADLSGVLHATLAQIEKAIHDETTKLPQFDRGPVGGGPEQGA
jgi:uncharacterized protein YjbI with pentapeptide repeats